MSVSSPSGSEPVITFDPELPIAARADEIGRAIKEHRVVVVAGETGSGKTTQLPKICLRAGLTAVAHTQPRRLAARSVAERIADEMQVEIGDVVGYQVRFTKQASASTRVKVMTDGVLLAEIGRDRDLRHYDCIIIDEAHERSLNIDFLLGYLKQLLERRDDLKVIITSATIDTERFAEHFADENGPCPIVEVSGRTYPVEVRYRPIAPEPASDDPDESEPVVVPEVPDVRDQIDAICDAVHELRDAGDILVFLSGEREIRDTADALTDLDLPNTEILPLYARLSAAEQQRVFGRSRHRRIVLATNVAETSITVPGIRAVIDPGTARISRYSTRTKVQRLPIEPISRASADQRAGRCGRVAPGICIRLYAEADFEARPEFTEPEILRTNLASVILKMADARLGDIASFPFVEPPDRAQVTDGLRLLTELGAITTTRGRTPQLTKVGRQVARIPLDPRMARMLVEAERRDCLAEVMVIVAGMTIQDPRERPTEQAEAATAMHRRFWSADIEDPERDTDPNAPKGDDAAPPDHSDFMALLRLWNYLRRRRRELSGNAFRRMCRSEFLHFVRIREWQDLHNQLKDITSELGMQRNRQPGSPASIHTAIVSGLLSNIGLAPVEQDKRRDRRGKRRRGPREFVGPRGVRFAINPGSSVAKSPPELVMAGELVETSRLWARTVAGIEAHQVEAVAGHLVKRTYAEPRWNPKSQSVVANESVLLLGVPLVSGRRANYGRVNPVEARTIFLRRALVEGEWSASYPFLAHNAGVVAEIQQAAERTRRSDLYDEEALFEFYDARIPEGIVSGGHFASWWRKLDDQGLLDVRPEELVRDPEALGATGFPDVWEVARVDGEGTLSLPVRYVFEPGAGHDGVTVEVPLSQLNLIDPAEFTWQVPGLRHELVTSLLRSLPKRIRTRFVPAGEHAARAVAKLRELDLPPSVPFPRALGQALQELTGEQVPEDAWGEVDGHLRPTFVVVDPAKNRREVGRSTDLGELQRRLGPTLTERLTRATAGAAAKPSTTWTFGKIAETVGQKVTGYPGLSDRGDAVSVVVHDRRDVRDREHALGLRRLVLLNTPDPTRWTVAHLSNQDKLTLGSSPYRDVPTLLADARLKSVGDLVLADGDPARIRDEAAFTALCDRVRADNADRMRDVVAMAAKVLRTHQQVQQALAGVSGDMAEDVTEQLANLVFDGFIAATDEPHFSQLPRYLDAALARVHAADGKDSQRSQDVWDVEDLYAELCASHPEGPLPFEVEEIGWLIEEFRVSVFAQRLGTRVPVSRKRIRRAIDAAPRP